MAIIDTTMKNLFDTLIESEQALIEEYRDLGRLKGEAFMSGSSKEYDRLDNQRDEIKDLLHHVQAVCSKMHPELYQD